MSHPRHAAEQDDRWAAIAAAVACAVREIGCSAFSCVNAPGVGAAFVIDNDAEECPGPDAALARAGDIARAGSRAFVALSAGQLTISTSRLRALSRSGVSGGLVIAIGEESGWASSERPIDSRHVARVACLPILEPADPEEGLAMARSAFELSEEFCCPVLIRVPGDRGANDAGAAAEVLSDSGAPMLSIERAADDLRHDNGNEAAALFLARERELANFSNASALNALTRGRDRRFGFVTAGPAYWAVRAACPESPILKMGLSYPLPMKHLRGLSEMCGVVVVIEEWGPIVESELRAEGVKVHGSDLFPGAQRRSPEGIRAAVSSLATSDGA